MMSAFPVRAFKSLYRVQSEELDVDLLVFIILACKKKKKKYASCHDFSCYILTTDVYF